MGEFADKCLQTIASLLGILARRPPDAYAQAVRGSFLFFQGSAVGGTMPTEAIFKDVHGNDCSSMIACAGLNNKTVEIRGLQLGGAHTVIIEGTISEGANDKVNWFPLTAVIAQAGLFSIQLDVGAGAPSALFYEPELTWLRIRAVEGEVADGTFPPDISATMGGVYSGYRWDQRFKQGAMGYPEPNPNYQGV